MYETTKSAGYADCILPDTHINEQLLLLWVLHMTTVGQPRVNRVLDKQLNNVNMLGRAVKTYKLVCEKVVEGVMFPDWHPIGNSKVMLYRVAKMNVFLL